MPLYNILLIVTVVLLALSFANRSIPSLVRIVLSILVVGLLLRLTMTVLGAL